MLWCVIGLAAAALEVTATEEREFVTWMRDNGATFVGPEYHLRLGVFLANKRFIASSNKRSFRLGLNKFAATTPCEYRARLMQQVARVEKRERVGAVNAPDELDWRTASYVSPVVDADGCASWSFASVVPFSHFHFTQTQAKVDFSYQNLLDCATSEGCMGCLAGGVFGAWTHVKTQQNGKAMSLSDYPATGAPGACKYDESKALPVMNDFAQTQSLADEKEMAEACATYGPLVSLIDASHGTFQLYESGVFDEPGCSSVMGNHYLVVVGYGIEGHTQYWICQNSFGTGWGEQGYIRMVRGKNICGISMYPWYLK